MSWVEQLQVLGNVAVAMLLGGLVGLERQAADKPAGLRTLMLVAAGSAFIVGLGRGLVHEFAALGELVQIRPDPFRLVGAVVTGLSFLGAGTIMRRGRDIEGLTTAASILVSGTLGIAVALHAYLLASGVALLTLVALRLPHDVRWPGKG